jgi:hypothetical protein
MAVRAVLLTCALCFLSVGLSEAADNASDDITGSVNAGVPGIEAPKATDFTRPIFTREVAPICHERKQLAVFSNWLMTYKTYDPALSRAMFRCTMAHDGEMVSVIGSPFAATRGNAGSAKVSWQRGDGTIAQGYAWVSRLRN